jgi:hypothetical protein
LLLLLLLLLQLLLLLLWRASLRQCRSFGSNLSQSLTPLLCDTQLLVVLGQRVAQLFRLLVLRVDVARQRRHTIAIVLHQRQRLRLGRCTTGAGRAGRTSSATGAGRDGRTSLSSAAAVWHCASAAADTAVNALRTRRQRRLTSLCVGRGVGDAGPRGGVESAAWWWRDCERGGDKAARRR